jgi:hypothetical protein
LRGKPGSYFARRSTYALIYVEKKKLFDDLRVFQGGLAGLSAGHTDREENSLLVSGQRREVGRADRKVALGEMASRTSAAVTVKGLGIEYLKTLRDELTLRCGDGIRVGRGQIP